MKFAVRIVVVSLIAIFVSRADAHPLPYYTQDDFTPVWQDELSSKTVLAKIPKFQMKNQEDHLVTEKSFDGKITVLNFFYASCGSICPMLMERMKTVNQKLNSLKNVGMASITITPTLDTPEKLTSYARKRKLNLERWSLLTGAGAEVRKIEEAFKANKDVPGKQPGEVVHSENIYLLDRENRVRGIYNASSAADLELLVQDVQSL